MLRHLGVKYVTLNPDSSFRGLHDSLVNRLGNKNPQMLLCLHEEHAASIAHGYAKVAGEPLAVIMHSNVGLMHGSMAVFNAWCDRVPMLVYGATGPVDTAAQALDRLVAHLSRPGNARAQFYQVGRSAGVGRGRDRVDVASQHHFPHRAHRSDLR